MPNPTFDFGVFDGQQTVEYCPAASFPTTYSVAAVRRPLSLSRARNIESLGISLQPTDAVFHLDGTPLGSEVLAAGDQINVGTGVTFDVLFVERQTLNATVVVVCRLQ